MPRDWYDWHANRLPDNPTEEDVKRREFNLRIIADKKPYFMRYIYPPLMKQYNTYIKNTKVKCMREFRKELDDLLVTPDDELTEEQRTFLKYYHGRMPVGTNDCVMNKICRAFEREFDGAAKLALEGDSFDTAIMKSGAEYTKRQFLAVSKLCQQYVKGLCDDMNSTREGVRTERSLDRTAIVENRRRTFLEECVKVCSNSQQLCDIVVDVCYQKAGTKQLAWDVCGQEIVRNLLDHNNGTITYPIQDDGGEVSYGGERFHMVQRRNACGGDYFERESMGTECAEE